MAIVKLQTCLMLLFLMTVFHFFPVTEQRSIKGTISGIVDGGEAESDKKTPIFCYDTVVYFTEEVCYEGRCTRVIFSRLKRKCVTLGYDQLEKPSVPFRSIATKQKAIGF